MKFNFGRKIYKEVPSYYLIKDGAVLKVVVVVFALACFFFFGYGCFCERRS